MTELLPCPFCGGAVQFRKALWPSDGCVDAVIHASPSSCGMTDFSDGTTDESILATWNTRAAQQDGTIKALMATAAEAANTASEDRWDRGYAAAWRTVYKILSGSEQRPPKPDPAR